MEDRKFEALLSALNDILFEIRARNATLDSMRDDIVAEIALIAHVHIKEELEAARDKYFPDAPLSDAEVSRGNGAGLFHRAPSALPEEEEC